MKPGWRLLLGGMIVWTGHFAIIYSAALIWGSARPAKLITAGATVIALALLTWLARRLLRWNGDAFERWVRHMALLGVGVASVSVLFQATPALFS